VISIVLCAAFSVGTLIAVCANHPIFKSKIGNNALHASDTCSTESTIELPENVRKTHAQKILTLQVQADAIDANPRSSKILTLQLLASFGSTRIWNNEIPSHSRRRLMSQDAAVLSTLFFEAGGIEIESSHTSMDSLRVRQTANTDVLTAENILSVGTIFL